MTRAINMLHGEPAYWCPVCNSPHRVGVNEPFANGEKWSWNGSFDKPTFTPSVHCYYDQPVGRYWILKRDGVYFENSRAFSTEEEANEVAGLHASANGGRGWGAVSRKRELKRVTICHVHVTKGQIQILADSRRLGGQTLPLEPWDLEAHE